MVFPVPANLCKHSSSHKITLWFITNSPKMNDTQPPDQTAYMNKMMCMMMMYDLAANYAKPTTGLAFKLIGRFLIDFRHSLKLLIDDDFALIFYAFDTLFERWNEKWKNKQTISSNFPMFFKSWESIIGYAIVLNWI